MVGTSQSDCCGKRAESASPVGDPINHSIQAEVSTNTIVSPGEDKAEKWRRTALEACKQCGRDTLMEIGAATSIADLLAAAPAGTLDADATIRKHR